MQQPNKFNGNDPTNLGQNIIRHQQNGSVNNSNEFIQRQILAEIQRFESVHPCIYRIYDLLDKIDNEQLANTMRQQVINIEDAFVNSQEWTLSRTINEIRLGVIGSDDSCKNSLIHYFLTRNWNWEDAPEGGRFKKEITFEGRSFLLLIRDEGSREPSLQFSQWLDALLIVFTLDNRKSFQFALELQQLVNSFRPLNAGDLTIYLVGMKNMANMHNPRMVSEEEAHRTAKAHKMCNYFECFDGSNVQRMFNNVCQRVIQQRNSTKASSFIGRANMGQSQEFAALTGADVMLNSMTSASNFYPAPVGRPSSYHHQRSVSVLPANNELSAIPNQHNQNPSRRAPRYEDVANQHQYHTPPANFRNPQQSSTSTKRDSVHWQHRPIAASPFAIPSTPSCSALLGGGRNNNNNQMNEHFVAGVSPAFSHNSLSSSHYQMSTCSNNVMAASPYTRSTSNMLHQHIARPCSDPTNQTHLHNNGIFFEQQNYPNSATASSTSTLVVSNNGNGGPLPTPGNTPKTERKGKRISNIFRKEHLATPDERIAKSSADINMGLGRAIPLKQGQLYKRSKNGLNKEWKKKYICLYPDGRICYYHNLKEYMDKDSRGKEIYLGLATVRTSDRHKHHKGNRNSMLPSQQQGHDRSNEFSQNEAEDFVKSPAGEFSEGISDGYGGDQMGSTTAAGLVTSTSSSLLVGDKDKAQTQKKEKQHKEKKKRTKKMGNGVKNDEEEDCCEFEIVSCDQKRWEFSANSVEERDQWVACIQQVIEKCLQQQLSLKDQQQLDDQKRNGQSSVTDPSAGITAERKHANIQSLRHIEGNDKCADCGALHPDWASINLGTLICIECSGIHRKLGSHVSKVRSLELDDWPPEHLVVMQAIGNALANQIWEHNASKKEKPTPDSTRDQKERWIKRKYEEKLYLPPIPVDRTLSQQLVDAVLARNIHQLLMVLPRCTQSDMNATIGGQDDKRTAVHLACGIGAPEILQLLIWYNSDIHVLDEQGRSSLWYAQVNGSTECAAILMQAGLRAEEGSSSTFGSRKSTLIGAVDNR